MKITKPAAAEYEGHFGTYINTVADDDLLRVLKADMNGFTDLVNSIPASKHNYRYAEGKWTIKEIVNHLTDAERIFAYRALRFARNDKTELPGFEENDYVPESNAANRSIESLVAEYRAVRQATIILYESFTPAMCLRMGKASGKQLSVRALGYVIAGHTLHHQQVIRERYLVN
ncbi:MAG TPA: DinB family protein [Chitinophagales bacterium]|nr:DinB family protein [Chitinophagales bacterium]